jgi:RNA polymerase sigma-70 factor, ECF subfamily
MLGGLPDTETAAVRQVFPTHIPGVEQIKGSRRAQYEAEELVAVKMAQGNDDDSQLIAALRADDRTAWLRLYDRYATTLWRHLARLLGGDTHAADDVVQATMMAAARCCRGYDRARGTLWMWLWGIARRQALLRMRTQRRESQRLERGPDAMALVEWLADDAPAPGDALESADTARLVRLAMSMLSEVDTFVLTSAYMERLAMARVAELMGTSVEAARSRAARARRSFREAFIRLAGRDYWRADHVS